MIDYRPFRNTDPPAICEFWRHRGRCERSTSRSRRRCWNRSFCRGRFSIEMGSLWLPQNSHPIGFAHAGFAVNSDGSGLDTSCGTTCMLMLPIRSSEVMLHANC